VNMAPHTPQAWGEDDDDEGGEANPYPTDAEGLAAFEY